MAKIRTAVLSVADKTGLPEFAQRLAGLGIELIGTHGTARALREHGVATQEVSEYTGFPNILDGEVRMLHPKLHAGLLAMREEAEHRRQMEEHGIRAIDMVVVNLYPHISALSESALDLGRALETIDIGGPTLVRSAAKNYTHVAVVASPAEYDRLAEELEQHGACLSEETHLRLAVAAFRHTAHYDCAIADYLSALQRGRGRMPERLVTEYLRQRELPHGENPHQRATLYLAEGCTEPSASAARHVAGTEPDFAALLDLDVGARVIKELDRPSVVLTAHANPVAGATADSVREALERAVGACCAGAPKALVANRPVDYHAAGAFSELLGSGGSFALLAPAFAPDAVAVLTRQGAVSRLSLMEAGPLALSHVNQHASSFSHLTGGLLVQDRDLVSFDRATASVLAGSVADEQWCDMCLATACCKHAHSCAATLVRDGAVVGFAYSMSELALAAHAALQWAGAACRGCVLALDGGDLPAAALTAAAQAGVSGVVISPAGETAAELVDAAQKAGLCLVAAGAQHLRH